MEEKKNACQRRAEGRHDLGLSLAILGMLQCTCETASCEDLNDEASEFQRRSWTSVSQLVLI